MKILYTHYKRYLLVPVLLLLAFAVKVQAQTTYPVQVNAHLLPPYSLYLSDYYSGTRDKLTLTLINRDQFKPTLNVRLRMTITAPGGVRLQTNDNAYVTPIIVETGAPVRLTQEDLEPYFRTDNLITTGFLTDGKLPEGMVQFCFQAIEAYTGRVLSASTCAQAFITSQKPPLLSLPLNNENIVYRDPLNILFQWTPLHQGLALVEYEFILKELWDNGMAVQAAFAYSPEIYRETTRSTSLPYGAVQPSLLPGKRYAWCIRAQARDGMETLNVFQNDGYTEVRTFTLQDNCLPPNLVNAVIERKTLKLDWPSLPEHIGFTVSYRLKSANGTANPWQDVQTLEPAATLYNLQSGSEYEYRVGSYCIAGQPVFTPILQATIPAKDSTRLAQCGIMAAVNLTNQEPLKQLKTSEVFMASDFPVTVTKVAGANGVFTGEGWIIVPWLNDAKVAVEFNSITVNTDRQMTAGYIDAKYDKNESQIADLDDVFEGGSDAGTVQTGITGIDYTFDFSIPGVESFTLNDDGDLVIADDSGEPHVVVPKDNEGQGNVGNSIVVFPMAVKDKDGKMYQVEKVTETDPATGQTKEVAKATYIGQVRAPLAAGSFDPDQLDGDKAIVTFQKGASRYAFDTWKDYYANVALIRDEYGDELWTGYRAAYKFLPENGSDVVQARIDIKDTKTIDPDKVLFITPKGTEYKATREGNVYTLTVTSGPVNDGQEVYALYAKTSSTYYTLGKVVVVTYAAQSRNVVLVSVNDAPVDEQAIRDTLQAVYGPVAVTWSVKKQEFDYTSSSDKLMSASTGLSTYNDAMSALNSAYKAEHAGDFDASANYLFFLKATGADEPNIRDYTGFMPRGAQFGYIFTSEITQNAIPTTVAHELGHGRWKLFHTFDNHYGGYNQGKTDNLMDYANGTVVTKWQWDILSDPAMLVNIFQSDDASANLTTASLPNTFLNGTTFNFMTPTGKKITLPEKCVVSFNFGVKTPEELEYAIGYLYSFTVLDANQQPVSYVASISQGKFNGYVGPGGKLYDDKLTGQDKNENVILFVPEASGIRYVQFASKAEAYTNGEAIKKYNEFPIYPFQNAADVLKKSELVAYSGVANIIKNHEEDWTLHADFLSDALQRHNEKPEHAMAVKIAELRTAYRDIFNEFTDCYEVWNKTLQRTSVEYDVLTYSSCAGVFEDILRKDLSRIDQLGTDPFKFYSGFLADLINYIRNQANVKQNFIDTVSLYAPQVPSVSRLQSFSNAEIATIPWDKREILLKVLARDAINDKTENEAVRLVKYVPEGDRKYLLNALAKYKDADNEGVLLYRYLGQLTDGLNGDQYNEFLFALNGYVSEVYDYSGSPFAQARNRLAKRFFSFNPSFWSGAPPSVNIDEETGYVDLGYRYLLTPLDHDQKSFDPYSSVTLHFKGDKSTDIYFFNKDSTLTTSAIMAYGLCRSAMLDNGKVGGVLLLNSALTLYGLSGLSSALATRSGSAVALAVTDIGLGLGAIVVDTKFRDSFSKTQWGRDLLDFWDYANYIYAGGRVGYELLSRANKALLAVPVARSAKTSMGAAEKAVLDETEAQARNVIYAAEHGLAPQFVNAVEAEVPGLLANHPDLRFIYGGVKPNLGSGATRFENALKSCSEDVMAKFNQHPELLYKAGKIDDAAALLSKEGTEEAAEAVIKKRLESIANNGEDFGRLRTAGGNVDGLESTTLFSKVKKMPGLQPKFDALDDAGKSIFLNNFKNSPELSISALGDNGGELFDIWKANRSIQDIDLLRAVKNYPAFYGKITGGSDLIGIRPYFNSLDQAGQANFINSFRNASDANLLKLTENGGDLFKIWKANQNVYEINLLQAIKTYPAFYGKITGGSDLIGIRPYFNSLDQAGQANFISRFQNAPDANLLKLTENSGELFNVWKVNQEIANVDLLRAIKDNPNLYAKIKGNAFNQLDDASKIRFIDDFKDATDDVLRQIKDEELFAAWKQLDGLGEAALKTDLKWLRRVKDWNAAGVRISKPGSNLIFSNAAGTQIGEFKNGNLLPDKYVSSGTPKGEPINGYQLVDNGGVLKFQRVPETPMPPYTQAHLDEMYQHERAHPLERHGHDVTDDALIKRANFGIAPDGSTIGNPSNPYKPPYSSRFESPEKLIYAFENTKPGTAAFAAKTPNNYPNGFDVILEPNDGTIFGVGVRRNTSNFENMEKVLASYEEVSPGVFELVTMYPIK